VKRRVPGLVAALALFAMLIPLTTSVVAAWSPPSIASVCSSDQGVHNWTVTLASESNYSIQWADNSSFTNATTVTMHVGANSLSTPSTVTTLYVRWSSDHSSSSHATWNSGACATSSPFQSFQGATATPVKTTDPCATAITAPAAFTTAAPCTTPTTRPTNPPTTKPTNPPTNPPTTPPCTVIDTQPAAFSTATPCPTPFQSFQGATATPVVTKSPFQSFQGETSTPGHTTTPPPTNTGGGPSNDSTPLFALMICFAAGGLGLAAVQAQRRSITR
jgi:hypothetical protein